jgi:pyruvate dehydrogenase E2 component (dihydrolipoyllysine-residue acetyltransferase)
MPYEVKLPDIGEGVAEGEIVRWLVKAGEAVREDQPLVEVMTDKASVEIPSPRTGTIAALNAEEGDTVPVGTVIVSIAVDGEDAGASPAGSGRAAAASPAAPVAAPAPAAASTAGGVQATPAVRQQAKKLGVALESVRGTGPGGRITPEDVERAAGTVPAGNGTASAPAAAGTEERIPLRGLRKRIAEHMRRSLSIAASFTFVAECDMTAVVAHRAGLKARAEARGIKLTYTAYVVKALIEPLRRYPLLNASLDDERGEIVLKRSYHIGIATDTPDGLTVPILHDADRMTLFRVASEVQRLADAARTHKLTLEELHGGTFTITSTGAKGGLLATPILHHPQVAILGVHEIKPRPAVVDGKVVARDMTNLSLTLDHRVVDGAVGADFLYAVIERLADPSAWLAEGEVE